MSEVKLSSKGQLVIPKSIRKKLSLKPGDKVKIEVTEGKKAILQASVSPPEEIFVRTDGRTVERILKESRRQDELKIKNLLKALGIDDRK